MTPDVTPSTGYPIGLDLTLNLYGVFTLFRSEDPGLQKFEDPAFIF
jgi:hypothetical protein